MIQFRSFNSNQKRKGDKNMSKCRKGNPNALQALQKWRDSLPKDKDGKTIYPKRKTAEEILKQKQDELATMMVKVEALKAEIVRLDKKVNADKIAALIQGLTAEELAEKLGK